MTTQTKTAPAERRWPRHDALRVAQQIVEELRVCCERIEIAGSIRRGKPTVGDIEILLISKTESRPDPTDLFATPVPVDAAAHKIAELIDAGALGRRKNINGSETWGDKNKLAVHLATGIPVDFFATTEENWWTSLVIRTGGLETNLELTRAAAERGRSLRAYGCGVENLSTGEITRAESEKDVFDLCGVKFQEAEDRK